MPLLPFGLACGLVLVWWSTIEPQRRARLTADVTRLPSAEIEGDLVTLRNIRSFEYRTAADHTECWYDKMVDLRQRNSLDLIGGYWMGDAIAHTMLSFGFAGEHVVISIETRKEQARPTRRWPVSFVVTSCTTWWGTNAT